MEAVKLDSNSLSWKPCVFWNHSYVYEDKTNTLTTMWGAPKGYILTVKVATPHLFDKMYLVLLDNKEEDVVITVNNPRRIVTRVLKEGYEEEVANLEYQREEEINALMDRLRQLGVIVEIEQFPFIIPNDYYQDSETYDYSDASFVVKCHEKTIMYQKLKESGILP